jgi:hypothetical protein
MAEFCEQCAREHGGCTDFAGFPRLAVVLCEGCGPTQVDEYGYCVSEDCDRHHGRREE